MTDISALQRLELVREQMHARAKEMLGVGPGVGSSGLRRDMRATGSRWYPLLALGGLVLVDRAQSFAVFVLGPEIAGGTGVTQTQLAALVALKTLAIALAALPFAALVEGRPRRALIAISCGIVWALATGGTGLATTFWILLLFFVLDGISTGAVVAIHHPLLSDSYPPTLRMRVISAYEAMASAGNVLSPVIVGLAIAWWGLSWRGVFLVLGAVALVAALYAVGLRDPGFGAQDHARVRDAMRGAAGRDILSGDVHLRFFEAVRRILLIPTARRLLAAYAVIGMAFVPMTTYLFFFLDFRWGLDAVGRSIVYAIMAVAQVIALVGIARPFQSRFSQSPRRSIRLASWLLAISMVAIALMVVAPTLWLVVILLCIGFGLLAAVTPAASVVGMTIIEPQLRPHLAALAGIAYAAIGGLGGVVLLSGLDTRLGPAGAIAAIAVPGLLCALVLRSAESTVDADFDRLVDTVVEREEIGVLIASGSSLPLLACRGIRFGFGPVEILHGVDFTVNEGEIVAFLGTNGAGKSTLLGVISGLHLPSVGTVRLAGADITYVDAERRSRMGIVQVPGGKAMFAGLTVREHLEAYAWSLGVDRRAGSQAIDRAFAAFPVLAAARDTSASSLSGGQQQMLAMTAALIRRPRLLCIDELSLGLAPVVVAQLLEFVREVNAEGTAIVLVEQSANVALSVAQRAYFLDKGEVRFDGLAEDLRGRTDLLRAIFLGSPSPASTQDFPVVHVVADGTNRKEQPPP
jgi:ABC-type branched-subunit amino acid transport system ATPase component/predicted MFS family arabinose efflux permease